MANGTCTCPRCGRVRRGCSSCGFRNNNRSSSSNGCSAAVAASTSCQQDGLGRCCCGGSTSIPQQLFGCEEEAVRMITCTDCSGTFCCNAADRNPFWPSFCRPRWLCCNQLYRTC